MLQMGKLRPQLGKVVPCRPLQLQATQWPLRYLDQGLY